MDCVSGVVPKSPLYVVELSPPSDDREPFSQEKGSVGQKYSFRGPSAAPRAFQGLFSTSGITPTSTFLGRKKRRFSGDNEKSQNRGKQKDVSQRPVISGGIAHDHSL